MKIKFYNPESFFLLKWGEDIRKRLIFSKIKHLGAFSFRLIILDLRRFTLFEFLGKGVASSKCGKEDMPKREDIRKIMLIGSGPIVIGQACEFDYSGVQACKSLKSEGYEVVLVNSNPATIMTDPETADRTYVEPITPEAVEKIIARERPDALLPTLGG